MFSPKHTDKFIFQHAPAGQKAGASASAEKPDVKEKKDESKESKEMTKGIEEEKIKDEHTRSRADVALDTAEKKVDVLKGDDETVKDIRNLKLDSKLETKEEQEIYDRFHMVLYTLISRALENGIKVEELNTIEKLIESFPKYENKSNPCEKTAVEKLKEIKNNPNANVSKQILEEWPKIIEKSQKTWAEALKLKDKPEGWMTKYPVISAGLVIAGAYGAYKIFKWIFDGDDKESATKDSKEKKGGFFSSWWGKVSAGVIALFTLGGLLRSDFVKGGVDSLQSYIKDKLGFDLKIDKIFLFLEKLSKGQIGEALKVLSGESVEQDPLKELHEKALADIKAKTGKNIEHASIMALGKEKYNKIFDKGLLGAILGSIFDKGKEALGGVLPDIIPIIGSLEKTAEEDKAIKDYFTKSYKQKIADLKNAKKITDDTTVDQVLQMLLEEKIEEKAEEKKEEKKDEKTDEKKEGDKQKGEPATKAGEGSAAGVATVAGAIAGAADAGKTKEEKKSPDGEKKEKPEEKDKPLREKMPNTYATLDKLKDDLTNIDLYFELAKNTGSEGGALIFKGGAMGILRAGKWYLITTETTIVNWGKELFKRNEWYFKAGGVFLMVEGPIMVITGSIGAAKGALSGIKDIFSLTGFKAIWTIPAKTIAGAFNGFFYEGFKLQYNALKVMDDWKFANIVKQFAFPTGTQAKPSGLLTELEDYVKSRGYSFKPNSSGFELIQDRKGSFLRRGKIPSPLQRQMEEQYKLLSELKGQGIETVEQGIQKGLIDKNLLEKGEVHLYKFTTDQNHQLLIEREVDKLKLDDKRAGKPQLSDKDYRKSSIDKLREQDLLTSDFQDPLEKLLKFKVRDIEKMDFNSQMDHLRQISRNADEYLKTAGDKVRVMQAAGKSGEEIAKFEKEILDSLKTTRDQAKQVMENLQKNTSNMDASTRASFQTLIEKELAQGTGIKCFFKKGLKSANSRINTFTVLFGVATVAWRVYEIKKEDKEKMVETELSEIVKQVGAEFLQLMLDIWSPFGVSDWYTVITGKGLITQFTSDKKAGTGERMVKAVFGTYNLCSDVLAALTTPAAGAGAAIWGASNAAELSLRAAKKGPEFYRAFTTFGPRILQLAENVGGLKVLISMLKDGERLKRILQMGKTVSGATRTLIMGYGIVQGAYAGYKMFFDTKDQKEMKIEIPEK